MADASFDMSGLHFSSRPWLVRKALGNKPTLLGKNVPCQYIRPEGADYMEVDCDIQASWTANNIFGLAKGGGKDVIVDLGFLLQVAIADVWTTAPVHRVVVHRRNIHGTKHPRWVPACHNRAWVKAPVERIRGCPAGV